MADDLVSYTERALLLKSLPVLRDARPDQIAAILEHARDRSFMPGRALFTVGESADEIHFILEGRVRLAVAGGAIARGPGEVVGLLAALERRAHRVACVSEVAVQTMSLRVDDLFALLEDFFDLSRALIAALADHVLCLIARGRDVGCFDGCGPPVLRCGRDLIDKIVFMKSVPLLAGASVDELARLGKEVIETECDPGEVLFHEGEPAEAFFLVMRGKVGEQRSRGTVAALDVLRQASYRKTAVVAERARLLRVPRDRFFDLLEDHFDMTAWIARDLSAVARVLQLGTH
jgi:CRP-like cAMP-binding protein